MWINIDNDDYLEFDLSGNLLCPPYPECILTSAENFWFQDTSECFDAGDINMDSIINIADIIQIVDLILSSDYDIQGDVNGDLVLNISDVILLINYILNET